MQKKTKKDLFRCCLALGLVSLISLSRANASGIFSSSNYYLSQGKDMLISPYRSIHHEIYWQSSNPEVASIDNHGIVHAKSYGSTEITAYKNNEQSKCILNVTESEPVRSVYTSLPKENENIHLYAVTPKSAGCVKFEISSSNFRKEIYSNNKSQKGDCYLWHEVIPPLDLGTYNLAAYSYINNQWRECYNSYITFNVSCSNHTGFEVSSCRKGLSKEGVQFIIGCEGFVSRAYKDIANVLTIGYGKAIYPYKPFYNNISKEESYQDFLNEIDRSQYISAVNNFLVNNKINFSQHHFDALLSFTYNLGKYWMKNSKLRNLILEVSSEEAHGIVNSTNGLNVRSSPNLSSRKLRAVRYNERVTLLSSEKINNSWYRVKTSGGTVGYCFAEFLDIFSKKERSLNSINKSEFIKAFLQYHHAGSNGVKKCFKGLLRRRIKELEIFFNGNYTKAVPINKYPIPSCIKI